VILGGRLVASGDAAEIRGLVSTLPAEVHVRCDQPRALAARLCGTPLADSLRFTGPDGIVIGTRQPAALGGWIAAAAAAGSVVIHELVPGDRSLEGVFDRLVRLHRGVTP